MDITDTLAPTSDQLDAVDLVSGPRIFTVERVSKGNAEQPVQVHLAEFDRVWRPGKSMRRVLAAAWGPDASTWTGRKVELYCDPAVMFGGQAVGGTRVSRLSHIDGPLEVPLLVKRGKSAVFTVQPLPDAPASQPEPTADEIAACTDRDELRAMWSKGNEQTKALIQARVAQLDKPVDAEAADYPTEDEPAGEVR